MHALDWLKCSAQNTPFTRPQRPVYPGPLGWANQLAQILVQEVRHVCSAYGVRFGDPNQKLFWLLVVCSAVQTER